MQKYFLGMEIGPEGLRAVVMDDSGQICGSEYRGYGMLRPAPGLAEQDSGRWTRSSIAASAGAIRRSGISPSEISAIGLSAMAEGIVPIGEDDVPTRNAIIWLDQRSVPQCKSLAKKIPAAEIFEHTGLNTVPLHVLPRLLWIRENEPELFENAKLFATPAAIMAHFLTGEWAVDAATASSTMLTEAGGAAWSVKMLELAGVDATRLPKILKCHEIVGKTRGAFAEQTGLLDVPVVAGAAFEQASALGIGVVEPGLVCDIISFVEPVCTITGEKFRDATRLMETRASVDSEMWFVENPGFTSGGSFKWLRDNFGKLEMLETADTLRTAYDLLNEQAQKAPAGAGGVIFFPFLSGSMTPEWNPHARGMITGFTLDHTRNHIIRAVLEGAAYALRDVVERMAESGLPVKEIRVVGGGLRSTLMEEIRANVTGVTVAHSNVFETAAYGSAMLAAVGAGSFSSAVEASAACVRIVRRFDPDENAKMVYDSLYSNYRLFFDRLKNDFETLWGNLPESGEI